MSSSAACDHPADAEPSAWSQFRWCATCTSGRDDVPGSSAGAHYARSDRRRRARPASTRGRRCRTDARRASDGEMERARDSLPGGTTVGTVSLLLFCARTVVELGAYDLGGGQPIGRPWRDESSRAANVGWYTQSPYPGRRSARQFRATREITHCRAGVKASKWMPCLPAIQRRRTKDTTR